MEKRTSNSAKYRPTSRVIRPSSQSQNDNCSSLSPCPGFRKNITACGIGNFGNQAAANVAQSYPETFTFQNVFYFVWITAIGMHFHCDPPHFGEQAVVLAEEVDFRSLMFT